LSWLIARELNNPSTVFRDGLLVSVVVGEGKGVRAIRTIRVVDDCIDIGRGRIEGSPNFLSDLFYLLFRFGCFLLLEPHVLDLHNIVVFSLSQVYFLIFRVALGGSNGLFAFYIILLNFGGINVGH
jgi:hypothetical protein